MNDLKSYYQTVSELLQNGGHEYLSKFCNERYMSDYVTNHDNWNGGIDTFNIDIEIPVEVFSKWQSESEDKIESLEKIIENAFETAVRGIDSIQIENITIRPVSKTDDQTEQTKSSLLSLHFEVQNKQGPRSDYIESVQAPKHYPCFILVSNWDWTDYDYRTRFCLFYFASADDKKKIGELKLMCTGYKNTIDAQPKEFDEPLNNNFCSLGIRTDYYIGLKTQIEDKKLRSEIQHYLCDCTLESEIYEKHCDEDIFKNSLMRDLSSIDAFNEGQSLSMDIDPDDMYSFKYTYHPEYDKTLYTNWNVLITYSPLEFMRTIGIIGNNGVGKTQILSKFVTDLLAENRENFKSLPHFKNLLVICSTPFDNYPVKSQNDNSIIYKRCCLEQDKIETTQILKSNFKKIIDRPTVDGCTMISLWRRLTTNYVDKVFVSNVTMTVEGENKKDKFEVNYEVLDKNVRILSSGQLHILSLITYICANIHYRSLLIVDEPEVHLHPHITMEFMMVLSKILTMFKSYAIIATHTPLVVREIAGKNVFLMQKLQDGIPQIAPVGFETLGEDATILYRNLFNYDEKHSFFKKMVDDFCMKGKSYDWIIKHFSQEIKLNVNALLIIRDAIEARDNAQLQ